MKDHIDSEIAKPPTAETGDASKSGESVWLAPALPQSMAPLLSGLGIQLLAPGERERATIRVEALAADGRPGLST